MSQYSGTPAGALLARPVKVLGGDFRPLSTSLPAGRLQHAVSSTGSWIFLEALCINPSSGFLTAKHPASALCRVHGQGSEKYRLGIEADGV
jgi:hypothetical protein